MGIEFQFGKMKNFWSWMVVAEQCECTECHRTVHLKMAKMVKFYVMHILPQLTESTLKTKKKWADTRGTQFPIAVGILAEAG